MPSIEEHIVEHSGRVILCVDDEENPLLLRKFVLQKAGYRVITASSGNDALAILRTEPIDLVLSDHLMPGMKGTELTRHIKELHPNLPVVLVSGVNEIPLGAERADLFVSKIEGPENLCAKISGLLSQPQRQEN